MQLLNVYPLKYMGALDNAGVSKQIQDSDILIHVESFEKKYRAYTKYSISTKISEYLASNRCIIAYGPNEIASILLFTENNIGITLTDLDSIYEMKQKLKKLIIDTEYRNEICYNALLYAKDNFNASKIINNLYKILVEI
jgi:glycosyltransferase involved in cell wall biosynthesis